MTHDTIRRLGFAAILALTAMAARGGEQGAEIRLNSDALEGAYSNRFHGGDAVWTLGWLHNRDEGDLFASSLHIAGPISSKPALQNVRAGLGGEVLGLTGDGDNAIGVALGGFIDFAWPDMERLELRLLVHYAPDVLTFGDADSFRRFGVEAGYRVLRRGVVFVGARTVRAGLKQGSAELDDGLHVGFRIGF